MQLSLEEMALKLMAALMIENRIAWTKDPECFGGQGWEDIAQSAIAGAKTLRRLLDEEKDREFPPVGQGDPNPWDNDSLATFN